MSSPVRSTWPEAAYALSLTKSGNWAKRHTGTMRATIELFCAHASAQGVFVGPIDCSHRDLASHLYRTSEGGVSLAGAALRGLVDLGVLRCIGIGSGTAPSEWDVAHYTRWMVPWRIDRAGVVEQMMSFAVTEIRAQAPANARAVVRALDKSARSISVDLEALSTASARPVETRASECEVFQEPQVKTLQSARYSATPTVLPVKEESSLSREGGRVEQARERAPIEFDRAFIRGAGIKYLVTRYSEDLNELIEAAGEARRSWLLSMCADESGPHHIEERFVWLKSNLTAPTPISPRRDTRDPLTQVRQDIAALEHQAAHRPLDAEETAELEALKALRRADDAVTEQPLTTMAV